MHVAVQPYTIRHLDESTGAEIRRVDRARYEGIELPVVDPATVEDALAATDVAVSSIATSLADLEEDFSAHRRASDRLGTEDLVVMWLDPDHFESERAIRETASTLDELARTVDDAGMRLHYHNHDHEFVTLDGDPALSRLYELTDEVSFELDLGWAGTGGVDPAALLRRIGDRVTHVHVKDMDFEEGTFVTFGEGDLDLAGVMDAAADVGVEWAIFENDEPIDPVAELSHGSLLLDEYTGHL